MLARLIWKLALFLMVSFTVGCKSDVVQPKIKGPRDTRLQPATMGAPGGSREPGEPAKPAPPKQKDKPI